jgi:hypothetical protein
MVHGRDGAFVSVPPSAYRGAARTAGVLDMTSQQPVMRPMWLMARINIGALLGMAAWLPWSGWQVATGQVAATPPEPAVRAALPSVGVEPAPMRLVPVSVAVRAAGHCPLPAATAGLAPDAPVSGADL